MKYRLVRNNAQSVIEGNIHDLIGDMRKLGYNYVGFNQNTNHRVELQKQPLFDELAGPMWDGDAVRYEDWQSYNLLSM